MDKKNIYAKLNLAASFNIHMLKKVLSLGRKKFVGLEQFRENFKDDNIYELTVEERRLFPYLERCIHCGLCTSVCDNRKKLNMLIDTDRIAVCFSRDLPKFNLITDALKSCEVCRECEEICPQDVPLIIMVEFMKKKAGMLKREG